MNQLSQQNLVPGLSLRTNFSWAFIGNAFYAACQWGMLILLAKIESPEIVGQYSLGLALTAPVIMFTNLNLRAVQVTDAKNEYAFGDYLKVKVITTLLALSIIIGIVLMGNYSWETSLVILAVGVAKSIESISGPFYGVLQRYGRMDFISKSMIIKGAVSLIVFGGVIFRTGNVFLGVVGLAITWFLVLISYDTHKSSLTLKINSQQSISPIILIKKSFSSWKWNVLIQLIWLALPLGFVMMFLSLNSNIPRILAERFLGQHELGIFSAIAYIQVVGTTVVGALGESASPKLADFYAIGDNREFSTLLFKLVAVGILLGGGGVLITLLAGKEILTILYRSEYANYDLFVRLMVAGGIMYLDSFLGYGITAARFFRVQAIITLLITGITTILCLQLIPSDGLRGAANSVIIASCIKVICYLVVTWYVLKVSRKNQISSYVNY